METNLDSTQAAAPSRLEDKNYCVGEEEVSEQSETHRF
jgi:hypothetical protein